ncbi:MAG: glycosyltransferase family 2 protein [Elusimicrobia bacterium]|nr:glycosyltransferase family 2 protein [Elusimicrobiota bacterium]
MKNLDLTISIVNYNTSNLLEKCLISIYQHHKQISFEIFVIDNASTDSSVTMVQKKFPMVNLIRNGQNLFFTKAHNQALSQAQGRYSVILNPDLYFEDNALEKIINFMDKDNSIGAAGPKILNLDGSVQGSGDRLPSFLYGLFEVFLINTIWKTNPIRSNRIRPDWDRDQTETVESLSGACMLVRSSLFKDVGILDERFLIYWEETDWCKRILEKGYKIYLFSEAKLYHLGSVGMDLHGKEKKEKIFFNSMLKYYKKHYGFLAYALFNLIYLFYNVPILKIIRKIKGWIRS